MAFADIQINVQYPIINGFVQVPLNFPHDKTRVAVRDILTAFPEAQIVSLSPGSGPSTGAHFGAQQMIRLPGLTPGTTFPVDPVIVLNTPGETEVI